MSSTVTEAPAGIRRWRPRSWAGNAIQPALTILALILLWEVLIPIANIPGWLLPAPSAVLAQLVDRAAELPSNTLYTLSVTVVGFGIAVVVGIALAVVIVYSPFLSKSILPLLVVAQAIPKVALAPILLIWVGYGQPSAILIAFLVAFFPMVVTTATGLRAVEHELVDLSRSLSASEWQAFRKVRFPSALPYIFSAAKVSVTLALIGAVIGEFVGADQGLGHMVILASSYLDTALAFGAIAILSILGILLFYAVHALERLVVPWFDEQLP